MDLYDCAHADSYEFAGAGRYTRSGCFREIRGKGRSVRERVDGGVEEGEEERGMGREHTGNKSGAGCWALRSVAGSSAESNSHGRSTPATFVLDWRPPPPKPPRLPPRDIGKLCRCVCEGREPRKVIDQEVGASTMERRNREDRRCWCGRSRRVSGGKKNSKNKSIINR